jgi:hypothetical protein
MNEIVYWSAKQLADAICTKELSSLEVVEALPLKVCPLECRWWLIPGARTWLWRWPNTLR